MSPETDYTRQRTVAELLAEHGGAPGGRRSRRGDGPQRSVAPGGPPPAGRGAPPPPADGRRYPASGPVVPDRSVLRDPVPRELGPHDQPPPGRRSARDAAGAPPVTGRRSARDAAGAPPVTGRRDRSTETIGDRRGREAGPSGPAAFR